MRGSLEKIVLILILWIAGVLAGGQFAKISIALSEFQIIYPKQADQIAWLLTLVSIVGAIFGGVAARLANLVGLQLVLIVSLGVGGGLSLWQATYPPYTLMALSRLIEGATHLGIVVTAPALIARFSSDKWRGTAMALWGSFFGVSFVVFGWFGIPFVEGAGVGALLQLHGLCLLVIASLVGFGFRRHLMTDRAKATSRSHPKLTPRVFLDPRIIWSGCGWLFYTLTFVALLTIIPAQFPTDLRSQVTTSMSLISITTGTLVVPVILLFFRAKTAVLAGFLLASLVTVCGAWSDPIILAISLFVTLGILQSGTFAAVAELNQSTDARTLGYGAMAQTGNLGNLLGTHLLLSVLEVHDFETLLIVTASLYGVGFLMLMFLARHIGNVVKSA